MLPDQIDISTMQSIPVMGPNGYLRLHHHWREPDQSMWDEVWDNTAFRDYWKEALQGHMSSDHDPFLKYLPSGAKVLEAGCGVGQVVLSLRANGFDCFGLDYAQETVQRLKTEFPDVPFYQGDIRELPFDENSFDGYISLGVIEHFLDGQELMLQEAARVVKPGGWIFVSVPVFNGWRKFKCRHGFYKEEEIRKPFFEACYSVEELENFLQEAGFELIGKYFQNTVMTFAQETPMRPFYRSIEDVRYVRGAIDRLLKLLLPKSVFGHMVMMVGRRV